MIKRYYSSYTGKQIDEAVKTIVENQIGLEDLSPELVAEIKSWVATGEGGEGIRELEFDSRNKFPELGNPLALYIATDEERIYYWSSEGKYKPLTSPTPDAIINRIAKNESDIKALQENAAALQTQITSANITISGNAVKIAEHESKILNLENALKDKANLAALNEVKASVENLSGIVGSRKEGETRSVFEILAAQEVKVNENTQKIKELNEKIPGLESNILSIAKELGNLAAQTEKVKYEVTPVDGLIIDYRDTEVRLNTQRVVPTHQSVGENGNPNMYYVTFKAYAPEGAVSVIEGNNGQMDAQASELSTDAYGRKYTTIWAAVANYSKGVWTKWGDNSTLDKYFGFLYSFHWLDKNSNIIKMDQVRVILTNDKCHTDLVPDVIARRIDEKVKEISQIDLNDYYTKEEVNALIPSSATIQDIVKEAGFTTANEVEDIIKNQGFATTAIIDKKLESYTPLTVVNELQQQINNCVNIEDNLILNGGNA